MKSITLSLTLLACLFFAGCVERLIMVRTDPAGAVVWLYGEEAGITPVTQPFLWYGEYEVVLRKDGYETLRTSREVQTPIYQWPLLDLVFESLWPGHIVDHHDWHFELTPSAVTDAAALIERAQTFRAHAAAPP